MIGQFGDTGSLILFDSCLEEDRLAPVQQDSGVAHSHVLHELL